MMLKGAPYIALLAFVRIQQQNKKKRKQLILIWLL